MIVIEAVLILTSLVLLTPIMVLLLQVLMALMKGRPHSVEPNIRPGLAVLIPAHDEAEVIVETLASIRPQLSDGDRLLVVADNCNDETAAIAQNAGAEVVERRDPEKRGKGFALDFGVRHLHSDPRPIVIIIDADCQVEKGALAILAGECQSTGQPVQGRYLMHAPEQSDLKMQIAEFAWLLNNRIRPMGFSRLGMPCRLMGSGMAFPWEIISNAGLASDHIVEDLKLGIDLAIAGHAPKYCDEAVISSVFPTSDKGIESQRTRWEHGFLQTLKEQGPSLLSLAFSRNDRSLLGLALDLAVPPLALLVIMLTGLMAVAVVVGMISSWSPLAVAFMTMSTLAVAILLAWVGWGRDVVSGKALLSVPRYVLSKIPLYFKYLFNRQKSWVRTDRDDH